ncbi:L-type lectin-domain containing receptor kinase [Melia azedarach]|uniref:L-type lectin-domain containing receptor kinase n=1 Tax=Melia azedarach TaxID=155640 RepID=A0ACC1YRC2_MELAZ|nr:L-type lectin-domain containing receptor kinase [Melia azedarach]
MAATFKSLYFGIVFSVFLISLALAQDENQFIYHGFKESKLHLDGLANILPNGLLLLTNSTEHKKGHAFYPSPIKFNTFTSTPFSFSTNFVFGMYYYGHGMAFVISPTLDFSQADDGPYFGLLNASNNGLPTNHIPAIELDTDQTFKFDDGSHVGIDVNSVIF